MEEAVKIKGENPGVHFDIEDAITDKKAQNFWKDVMGTIWGDSERKYSTGTISTKDLADVMMMPDDRILPYLYKCATLGLTDRQGGGWVI
jgi:hypothetical protein